MFSVALKTCFTARRMAAWSSAMRMCFCIWLALHRLMLSRSESWGNRVFGVREHGRRGRRQYSRSSVIFLDEMGWVGSSFSGFRRGPLCANCGLLLTFVFIDFPGGGIMSILRSIKREQRKIRKQISKLETQLR